MSVIGFDIGNLNCYVAVAKKGGIETVANDYSDRCTPAIVGFNNVQRLSGVTAKNQHVMNFKNTITQIKRLIGHKYDEPYVQDEIPKLLYKIMRLENGDIGIQVQYRGESKVFTPEQILAMLLNHLRETATVSLGTKIIDCVISVPTCFTDIQRRSVLQAADIAGLNALKLMNETSAVALGYGLFKQDLPTPEEKPRNVVFVDMGHASLQVSIVAFNKGKMKVLSTASDFSLGGRNFDEKIANYFNEEFKVKYKIDAKSNPKAWLRLLTAVEKIKKQMSSNTIALPFFIECFMNDKDVSSKIDRAIFEQICMDLLERLQLPMMAAMQDSGLQPDQIEVVEIVGGSTRIPALKNTIEAIFGKQPSTTLNQDEAVARGCAIQCAMLSHTVRVRDFEVLDAVPYPINISWDAVKPGADLGEMEVFKKNHTYPFTKLLTFPHRVEPFCFKAFYRDEVSIPHIDREIGDFIVNAAAPSGTAVEKIKVKVKVRIDKNGCFSVSSASMVEVLPPVETTEVPMETTETAPPVVNGENKENVEEKMEEQQEKASEEAKEEVPKGDSEDKPEKTEEPPKDNTETKEDAAKTEENVKKPEVKKPKKLTKSTDLTVDVRQGGPTRDQINELISLEKELQFHARIEKERSDAKNAVEEYVYAMKDKLFGDYESFITEEKRDEFNKTLDETEEWLYDEGDNQEKQVYADRLSLLMKSGQPIVDRCEAHTALPAAFENFGKAITHYRKILDLYKNKDEKYDHIEESEMKKVQDKVDDRFNWFNQKLNEQAKCPKSSNPAVYPSQIESEKKLIKSFCDPIINKSKPKVEPPKDDTATPPKDDTTTPKEDGIGDAKSQETPSEGNPPREGNPPESMDTDTPKPEGSKDLDMEVD